MTQQKSQTPPIPLIDLQAQYQTLKPAMDQAISQAVESQRFVLGPAVERFEADFARYLGVGHCLCLQSGTAAVHLGLQALGIGPGDEVITTPLTFFATVEGILLCGAKPVFADVDARTLNLDPAKAEAAVTSKTRAIVPVHLYGQCADMDAFRDIAKRRNLMILEDAAQAAGSLYKGKKAGSFSNAAAFSFYPGKNLGAYGDAGAVVTSDEKIARSIKLLRNHGMEKKNYHDILAGNSRLETIQGAVLSVKLPHLDGWNAARRRKVEAYRKTLAKTPGLSFIEESPDSISNYHLCVVRHARRDELLSHLQAEGIQADIHYPVACHLQPACGSSRLKPGTMPIAEKAVSEILSLPLYAELTDEQQARVIAAIASF
jgi:dTDP-4-amino-4,6-dideoxygalactose transaminase